MTALATDALVEALEASEGLPVPTPREYATRIEHALAQRGYEITEIKVSKPTPGYPCTCRIGRGCLAHPFAVRVLPDGG